jgi:Uma2 family endonuclease
MATVTRTPSHAILRGVSYDVYEALRDEPRNRGLRMSYHDGTLEIMSPELTHEVWSERLSLLIRAYAAVFRIRCQGTRATTFRRGTRGKPLGNGKEPDLSYYFENSGAIRGKKTLDLQNDPPPDLWIEVDHRASSLGRLPTYAKLGIPEVWSFRASRFTLQFRQLEDGSYREINRSGCLPGLTPDIVLTLLAEEQRLEETEWDRWMRDWMRVNLRHDEH